MRGEGDERGDRGRREGGRRGGDQRDTGIMNPPKNGKKNCVTVSIQNPNFPNASVIIS